MGMRFSVGPIMNEPNRIHDLILVSSLSQPIYFMDVLGASNLIWKSKRWPKKWENKPLRRNYFSFSKEAW